MINQVCNELRDLAHWIEDEEDRLGLMPYDNREEIEVLKRNAGYLRRIIDEYKTLFGWDE